MKRDGLIQGTVGTAGRRGRPQTGDRKESWGRRTWRRTRQPMTRSRGPHAFEPSGAWGTEERPFSWWERVPTGNCARVRLRGGEADDVWLARSQLEISGAKTGANPWWASGLGFGLRCSRCLEVRSYGGRWHRPWKAVVPKNEEADADDEDKDVENLRVNTEFAGPMATRQTMKTRGSKRGPRKRADCSDALCNECAAGLDGRGFLID
ncbi:hypothetical protein AXG93_4905s1140 [Marchantia polymorpha subsp. ruderalis]|uniref:Uncharacterized protein n=1 Tax=Marchantia polymorpha subsp. ruderalis TaxID=1480154 RepID=A0A176VHM9_MARPO|nr:hypothetical protein AXG93_4905s1140 [Marchantia polymorpha subsp. ruderalis]